MTDIKTLRKKLGLTQDEMAEKLDVSQGRISQWENGDALSERDKLALEALEKNLSE